MNVESFERLVEFLHLSRRSIPTILELEFLELVTFSLSYQNGVQASSLLPTFNKFCGGSQAYFFVG
jgi:hypothetical protein